MFFRFSLLGLAFLGLVSLFAQGPNKDWLLVQPPMPGHFDASGAWFQCIVDTAALGEPSLGSWLEGRGQVQAWELRALGPKFGSKASLHFRLSEGRVLQRDWSFLLGSCAFQFPFPLGLGFKRKRRNRIFDRMRTAHADAAFMLWTGDNVYLLFGQEKSESRSIKEYLRVRRRASIINFLQAFPQYATWDDHDYGPNNSDGSYIHKDKTLSAFQHFWANPSYGQGPKDGIYTKFTQGDAEFFLLDSRYHCDKTQGCLLNSQQQTWLEQSLKASKAPWKIIVSGSQMLSTDLVGETFARQAAERQTLLDFIAKEGITGLIFISGDRHFSELMRLDRPNAYPLYEFTCSPLTSFLDNLKPKKNDHRLPATLVITQNFGRMDFYGPADQRVCRISCYSAYGILMWSQEIYLKDLQ